MAEMQTLKVEFEGDLRRLRLKLPKDVSEGEKLQTIQEAIRHGFSWSEEENAGVTLKYKDEEGDLCTLVEATVEDFLAQPAVGALRLLASRQALTTPKRVPVPSLPEEPGLEPAPTPTAAVEPVPSPTAKSDAAAPDANESFNGDAGFAAGHPSFTCGSSVGPWKLLMCLRGLWDAEKMSAKMVGSMMLQFLPILAQRAHRKQEKLNRLGPSKREELLPLLRCVSVYIERVAEAAPLKAQVEDFISGRDVTKLGDFLAALFKTLAMSKDRHGVAEAINGVAEGELLNYLPQIFPAMFDGSADAQGPGGHKLPGPRNWEGFSKVAIHHGVRCSACNAEPVAGPRFRCAESGIDLCGECFIDQGCEFPEQFECHFLPPECAGGEPDPCKAWHDKASKQAMKEAWKAGARQLKEDAKAWKEVWKEWKSEWKKGHWGKGWPGFKGKGKGKGKMKGHFWCAEPTDYSEGAAQAAAPSQAGGEDGSDTQSNASTVPNSSSAPFLEPSAPLPEDSCAPPGLEAWCSAWQWKGKGGGKDRSAWAPWAWPNPWHGPGSHPWPGAGPHPWHAPGNRPFPPMDPAGWGGWEPWGPWSGNLAGQYSDFQQLASLGQQLGAAFEDEFENAGKSEKTDADGGDSGTQH